MIKVIKDVLFGFLVLIATIFAEFLMTIPFGLAGGMEGENFTAFMNREFLITAIPAGLITFLFAWLTKTNTWSDALRKSIIWTLMIGLYFLLVGMGNGNIAELFGAYGLYLLFLCAFFGPLIFAKLKLKRVQANQLLK